MHTISEMLMQSHFAYHQQIMNEYSDKKMQCVQLLLRN